MDKKEILFTRRSIRQYKEGTAPDKELIEELIHAAMCAPSARNKQPWHFVIVKERENLKKLADLHPYGKMLNQAALAVLVCGDLQIDDSVNYLVQDCSAATQNLLLAAHANGLGAVWLGIFGREERMAMMTEFFKLPSYIIPISLISIGYPAEEKAPNNNFNAQRLHIEQW